MRRACSVVLACACAVAGLVGCSSGHGPPRSFPPNAYALDVTAAGRVRWHVPLPLPALGSGRVSPLAVGAVAVFAQTDVLYGLRLSDGHQVWSRALSGDTAGMWRWQGLIIALTDTSELTGLDASTGRIRWARFIAQGADGSYATADGGLAIFRGDDALEVVDLSSGRVRWARPAGHPAVTGQSFAPSMAVAGGAVLYAVNGQLTSYNDRTGQIRWTATPRPIQPGAGLDEQSLQAAAGLVYLTAVVQQGASGQPGQEILGISAADGRVQWQFAPSPAETLGGIYAPGLMSVTVNSGSTWQDELDPATGRVRWQVASAYQAIATPAGIVTAPGPVGTDQISVHDTLTGQIRWTARLAGLNLGWQRRAPALPVFPAGPLLVAPAAGLAGPELLTAFRMSDGQRAWQITIPEPVAAPPLAVPGGMLIYCADQRLLP